jgi:hypothetical protein
MLIDGRSAPTQEESTRMLGTCTHCTKPDVVLTNGRVVTHRPMANGAHEAIMLNDPADEMSHAEWEDYCARIVGYAPKKQRLYKTARAAISCAAFPKGAFVAVRYSHTANGVDWYDITSAARETAVGHFESVPCSVSYPAHHLTDFCL